VKDRYYGWLGGAGTAGGVTVNDAEPLTFPKVAVIVVLPPTAKDAEPLTTPELAVMVVLPTPALTASPSFVTLATLNAEEFQVATVVRFRVLPSVNVPIAMNCTFAGTMMNEFAGVTAIDFRLGVEGAADDVDCGAGDDEVVLPPPHPQNVSKATPLRTRTSGRDFILSIPHSTFRSF
jgi:hypothetical protein